VHNLCVIYWLEIINKISLEVLQLVTFEDV